MTNTKVNKFELIEKQFGGLTVIDIDIERTCKGRDIYYLCKCSCGNTKQKSVLKRNLLQDKTKHCGCNRKKKHGLTNTRIHNIWKGMRSRCNNSNYKSYKKISNEEILRRWTIWFNQRK